MIGKNFNNLSTIDIYINNIQFLTRKLQNENVGTFGKIAENFD
jgi:hypothetical protein